MMTTMTEFKLRIRVFFIIAFVILRYSYTVSAEDVQNNDIDSQIRDFLEGHCLTQNNTLEDHEFNNFIACKPLHAGTILSNLPKRENLDADAQKNLLVADIANECKTWPLSVEGNCRKKFLQVVQKCFDEQRRFVFHFMTALTGIICESSGENFVDFWLAGGHTCLNNHLSSLTQNVKKCFQTNGSRNPHNNSVIPNVVDCMSNQFVETCSTVQSQTFTHYLFEDVQMLYNEMDVGYSSFQCPLADISTLYMVTALFVIQWNWFY